jgi:hypothetical protein
MTLHVICAAYQRVIPLRILIDSFLVQTNPNWLLTIIHDGEMPPGVKEISEQYNDERITFGYTGKRNGFSGFGNRDMILKNISGEEGDFVMSTNDDNYYMPTFVECFLNECKPGVGIVYCNMIHSHFNYSILNTVLQRFYIDMGAFAVKLPLAKKIGITYRDDTADGRFAEACLAECNATGLKTVKIEKILYVHN